MNASTQTILTRATPTVIMAVMAMGALQVSANEGDTATGARFLLSPSGSMVRAGDRVAIDVLVDDVADLQTFQVTLESEGGDRGSLILEDIVIDESEHRHAFKGATILKAANVKMHEAAGVHLSSSVNIQRPAVLASFYFRASDDAAGTFVIKSAGPDRTFLRDSTAAPIEWQEGAKAEVRILTQEKIERDTSR